MAADKIRVNRIFPAAPTSDGAGVKLMRALGNEQINRVDPFLLLDEFSSNNPDDYVAGFPPHPHRGFETVTYILQGVMKHEDSAGNSGILRSGGVQWMSAGRGVIHSEMPEQREGVMHGFQLWVNLPRSHKMMEPRYQNIEPEAIPQVELKSGGFVRVIAGQFNDAHGPVKGVITNPIYLDVKLQEGEEFDYCLEPGLSLMLYLFEGESVFDGDSVTKGQLLTFGAGERLVVRGGSGGGRFLLLAALPINEPVARGGPFVMNTRQEIMEAFADYESGRLISS